MVMVMVELLLVQDMEPVDPGEAGKDVNHVDEGQGADQLEVIAANFDLYSNDGQNELIELASTCSEG